MEGEKNSSLLVALKFDEIPFTNQFVYVEENNNVDGSFIISSIIKHEIERNCNILLVLCHNSVGHFQSVSQKLNYNLMSLKELGRVAVIDILEKITNENFFFVKEPLKELYKLISGMIELINDQETTNGLCIILENLGNLILVDIKEMLTFITSLRALMAGTTNINLLCTVHNFPDSFEFNLMTKTIRHFADVSIILKDLQTGRANDVTGHLSVTRTDKKFMKHTSEYQYQLQDKSITVFEPGTRNFF